MEDTFSVEFRLIDTQPYLGLIIDACKKLDTEIREGEVYKIDLPLPEPDGGYVMVQIPTMADRKIHLASTLVCFTSGRVYASSAIVEIWYSDPVILDDYNH